MEGLARVSADELIRQWLIIQAMEGAEKLVALFEWEDRVWAYVSDRDGSNSG